MLTPPTLCPPDAPRGLDAQLVLKKEGETSCSDGSRKGKGQSGRAPFLKAEVGLKAGS